MLNKIKGPTSYADLRTIDGITFDSFKEACYVMGLLDDDKEYIALIKEVHHWSTGNSCRLHFVSLITSDSLSFPDRVWKETCDLLSDDLTRECPEHRRTNDPDARKRVLHNIALVGIEKELNSAGYSLRNIPNMLFPDFEFIQSTFDKDLGGVFLLYGYGGTGKTFVWKTLAAAIRSRGDIVINVASSGITALLLTEGRTAHSRFAIPINVLENSFCSIKKDSELTALLNKAKLIIWDETPMMHMHCFEAFDCTMCDIIVSPNSNAPFGGKIAEKLRALIQPNPEDPNPEDIINQAKGVRYLYNSSTH
ncbi:uncharacterized protein [Rutidosis leptorrhynchoides]|uniref:uncharacterized protein n=1 Tax=Rutidosis leptorrhynchoides TaxID=125765 RepID=UPI003A9A4F73